MIKGWLEPGYEATSLKQYTCVLLPLYVKIIIFPSVFLFPPLGGHYVAFAKNSLRSSWFEYNDTRVHPVSADTVLSAEGYVLFYK